MPRTGFRPAVVLTALFIALGARAAADWPLLLSADFSSGRADGWRASDPSHWRVGREDGSFYYELTAPGAPGRVRAPTSWSVLEGREVSAFVFSGRLRCQADPTNIRRDMDIFFYFMDAEHFAYVHFAASSDEVHNIIGLVDGADRVKINLEPVGTSTARLTGRGWHAFKVMADGSGRIEAFLDDMTAPILTARLPGGRRGLVGVGSFDDTGAFADLRLWGR
jgi:hypothetical protein